MAVQLIQELFAYDPDREQVISLQRWSGFQRPARRPNVWAFVMVVNGKVVKQHPGTATQVQQWFTLAGQNLPSTVASETALAHLARITNTEQRRCADEGCAAPLPMGGLWCTTCGRPQQAS